MGKVAENDVCSSSCFSRISLLCVAVLVPALLFAFFCCFGFSPFLLTLPILIISTVFVVTFKKKKVILGENTVQEEGLICNQKILPEKEVAEIIHPLPETADESIPEILVPSDSESSDNSATDEKSNLELMCSNYMEQKLAMSDVSDSDDDDDSLIEISLPGSKFAGLGEEEPTQKPQSNPPDLFPESVFQQQGLMELLAEINEMNEEDNLIEIDLGLHQAFKSSQF